MTYYFGNPNQPSQTNTRKQEVKVAIESDEAPGATEAKRAPTKEDTEKTKKEKVEKEKKQKEKVEKEKKQKEKKKEKTNFPPGLVVSEKAKEKMAKIQIKISEKQAKQTEKRQEQQDRWSSREDVIQKWEEQEQAQIEETDKMLEQWDAQDAEKAETRETELKAAPTPEAQQEIKNTYANEDRDETLQRAEVVAKVEEENLVTIEKREKDQLKRDRVYNFFIIITRKPRREVPEDLPFGLNMEIWAIILIIAFVVYILTKD